MMIEITGYALEEACKDTNKRLEKNVFTQKLEIIDNETGEVCHVLDL